MDIKNEQSDDGGQGFIYVDFAQLGSVLFDFRSEKVSPIQMIAIGEYLITLGKSALLQEQARMHAEASQQQIAIPRPGMPNIDPTKLK